MAFFQKTAAFRRLPFFFAINCRIARLKGMKWKSGQLEALENEWFEKYHPIIHGYLFAQTQNIHLADDLAQETFVKAWENRSVYQEKGQAKAFLFQIATRCLKDFYRKKREVLCDETAWTRLEKVSGEPGPEEMMTVSEEVWQLRRTMAWLSESQRQILTMRYFGQLKFSEIARVLEMPLNTVLSHAHRGLTLLRERMRDGKMDGIMKEGEK